MSRGIGPNIKNVCAALAEHGPMTAKAMVTIAPQIAKPELIESLSVKANRLQKYINRAVNFGFARRVGENGVQNQVYEVLPNWRELIAEFGGEPKPEATPQIPPKACPVAVQRLQVARWARLRNNIFDVRALAEGI